MSRHHHIHHKHDCQDPADFWHGILALAALALFAVIILVTIQFWQISVPIIIGLVTLRYAAATIIRHGGVVFGSHLVTPSAEDRVKAQLAVELAMAADDDPEVAELTQQVADAKRRNEEIKEMRRQQAMRDAHLAELRAQLDALDGEYKGL